MSESYFDLLNRLWEESGLTVSEFAQIMRDELAMWEELCLSLQGDVTADS